MLGTPSSDVECARSDRRGRCDAAFDLERAPDVQVRCVGTRRRIAAVAASTGRKPSLDTLESATLACYNALIGAVDRTDVLKVPVIDLACPVKVRLFRRRIAVVEKQVAADRFDERLHRVAVVAEDFDAPVRDEGIAGGQSVVVAADRWRATGRQHAGVQREHDRRQRLRVQRTGISVFLTTVRSAKLECTRSTPGSPVRCWLCTRS